MFADTLTLTVNSVAKNLIRINQDGYSSEYRLKEATGEYSLNIRNTGYTDKKRGEVSRHNVEFVQTVYPVAPATTPTVRKAYLVFEDSKGDTIIDPVKVTAALVAFLTEANLTKLVNWES